MGEGAYPINPYFFLLPLSPCPHATTANTVKEIKKTAAQATKRLAHEQQYPWQGLAPGILIWS